MPQKVQTVVPDVQGVAAVAAGAGVSGAGPEEPGCLAGVVVHLPCLRTCVFLPDLVLANKQAMVPCYISVLCRG